MRVKNFEGYGDFNLIDPNNILDDTDSNQVGSYKDDELLNNTSSYKESFSLTTTKEFKIETNPMKKSTKNPKQELLKQSSYNQ